MTHSRNMTTPIHTMCYMHPGKFIGMRTRHISLWATSGSRSGACSMARACRLEAPGCSGRSECGLHGVPMPRRAVDPPPSDRGRRGSPGQDSAGTRVRSAKAALDEREARSAAQRTALPSARPSKATRPTTGSARPSWVSSSSATW